MVGRPSPRSRQPHARPRLEQLEDRSLLAAHALGPVADHLLVTTRDGQVHKVKLDDGASLDAALASYRGRGDVAFAEPDWKVSISLIPNDTRFGELYGLHNTGQAGGRADADIDAPEAWDITTGSASTVVAVIDTGVDYTHNDLYLNTWINQAEIPSAVRPNLRDLDRDGLITFYDLNDPVNQGPGKIVDNGDGRIDGRDLLRSTSVGGWADGTSNNGDGFIDDLVGWDFINNDNDPMDDNDHGTHVAGTIGAMGNNALGVVGVNWKVQIAGLKFLSSFGGGDISDAQRALDYAVARGIKISNNSWGGGGFSTGFNNSLTAARNAGHIFVAAAGNSANDNDAIPSYPASYGQDNIVAVAATDRNDNMASFSSFGRTSVDIGAPGVAVLSTTPGNTYSSFSGTSMATPHVAGALALLASHFPGDSYSDLIRRAYDAGDPVTSLANRTATGKRLNVAKAFAGLAVVTAVPNGTAAVSSVRVTFSEAIDPASFTAEDIALTGPAGSIAVNNPTAADATNRVFDITFAEQTDEGTYTFDLGPDVTNPAGKAMDQDRNGTPGERPGDVYRSSFAVTPDRTAPTVVSAAPTSAAPISRLRVTFSEAIALATFTAGDVALTGPSGSIPITGVSATDTTNRVFEVTFAPQSAVGTYNFTIGPEIADTADNPMAQAYSGSFAIAPAPTDFTYTSTRPVIIPDWGTATSTINVPDNIRITDVNVKLNITHTYDSDLTIRLRSPGPNARTITLINRRGGSGSNFTDTVLDDEARTLIRNGRAPFTGSFRPEQALTAFDGRLSRGVWTLTIIDNLPIDEGVLRSWSLTFAGSIILGGLSVEGGGLAVVDAAPAAPPTAAASAPLRGDGGLASLAVALGDAGEAAAPAAYATRHDTREAPAAVVDALVPRPAGRAALRDEVLRGLARRGRPAPGWAAAWEDE